MFLSLALAFQLAPHIVRSAALAFGGGDEEVVACNGERAGVPFRGDETDWRCIRSTREYGWSYGILDLEHGNCVKRSARGV